MHEQDDLGKILVISPHLDDGVFSCGALIAAQPGAVVLTVFAGVPDDFDGLTEWDATCGFLSARQALAARRAEDRAALELLQAEPHWCDFCDSQYRRAPRFGDVVEQLSDALHEYEADTVVMPLGLFHGDHVLAHAAAVAVLRDCPRKTWLAYEDAQYRRVPGLLQQRLAALSGAGIQATPKPYAASVDGDVKRGAVERYASQLRGLSSPGRPGYLDVFAPERYWHLTPGWSGRV
jgi:LmbE family N-acetylglucosaminyl deacetylase